MSKSKRRREEEARRAREAAERAVIASDPAVGDAAAPEAESYVAAQEALTVREAALAAREAHPGQGIEQVVPIARTRLHQALAPDAPFITLLHGADGLRHSRRSDRRHKMQGHASGIA